MTEWEKWYFKGNNKERGKMKKGRETVKYRTEIIENNKKLKHENAKIVRVKWEIQREEA